MLSLRRPQGSSLERWLVRLGAAAVIAGALGYIPYRVYGSDGYVHYRKLSKDLRELERGNARLTLDNAERRREIERLTADTAAVGRVARDELGMVAPGEVVIQIERTASPAIPPGAPTP